MVFLIEIKSEKIYTSKILEEIHQNFIIGVFRWRDNGWVFVVVVSLPNFLS